MKKMIFIAAAVLGMISVSCVGSGVSTTEERDSVMVDSCMIDTTQMEPTQIIDSVTGIAIDSVI